MMRIKFRELRRPLARHGQDDLDLLAAKLCAAALTAFIATGDVSKSSVLMMEGFMLPVRKALKVSIAQLAVMIPQVTISLSLLNMAFSHPHSPTRTLQQISLDYRKRKCAPRDFWHLLVAPIKAMEICESKKHPLKHQNRLFRMIQISNAMHRQRSFGGARLVLSTIIT